MISKWKHFLSVNVLLGLSVVFGGPVFAQADYLPLNRDYIALFESDPEFTSSAFHSSIRPFMRSQVNEAIDLQSVLDSATPTFMNFSVGDKAVGKSSLTFHPIFDIGYGRDLVSGDSYTVSGLGLSGLLTLGKKVSLAGIYNTANRGFVNYIDSSIQTSGVAPGFGYAHPTKQGYAYSNFEGYISFSPSDYFNFQLGQGKKFFGNGYRSLLLSDVANNYPFFKISTTVWKFKYVNLFTMMNSVDGSGGDPSKYQRKYATFHYLSWNVAKWLNISLFESIVWAGEDSSGVRGYDANYLNPLIFYRPVEFSLGSSDNAIIGTNIAAKIGKSTLFYGQVVLDEFFLVHVRAKDGWWANKQGFQVGLKTWNLFKVDGLSLLVEYNRVRPFTYSHGLKIQNYSHFNQALAHPLGANFYETLSFLSYSKGQITIEGSFVYAITGVDTGSSNYGGNIFLDFNTTRTKDFDNFIGQGMNTTVIIGGLKASYLIYPEPNLRFEMGINVRSQSSSAFNDNSTLFTLGLTSALKNTYHNF